MIEKGHSDLFFEKLIPATTKNKFDVNTNDVPTDDKAKFMAEWKKEKVDCAKDIAKRKSIVAKLAPKLPSLDKNLVISDLPEVKEEFGNDVSLLEMHF